MKCILAPKALVPVVTISGTRVHYYTSGAYWQARDMILEFHFDSRWAQRDDGFVD